MNFQVARPAPGDLNRVTLGQEGYSTFGLPLAEAAAKAANGLTRAAFAQGIQACIDKNKRTLDRTAAYAFDRHVSAI